MKLSASPKSYYSHLWELFFYLILFGLMPCILELLTGKASGELVIKLSMLGGVIFCVPVIFLFWRYVALNKHVAVEYQKDTVYVFCGENSRVIDVSDIERVEIKVTLPVYFNGFRYFATDSYFYAVIRLKSGEHFVVTSLIDNELIETLYFFRQRDDIGMQKKWSFICWPPGHQLALNN